MSMPNGTYLVSFESNLHLAGYGLIKVSNGKLVGRDEGYRYLGVLRRSGGCLRGRVVVNRIAPQAESIFGAVDRFELVVSGSAVDGVLRFSGHVLGAPHLKLRFRLESAFAYAAE